MLSAVIPTGHSYPALPLARQPAAPGSYVRFKGIDQAVRSAVHGKTKGPLTLRSAGFFVSRQRPTFPQPRGGSIMSPGGLNFRVRDGNGWNPSGVATGNFAQGKSKKSKVRPTFAFYL